jgi:ketosteroid isomerase-like protein
MALGRWLGGLFDQFDYRFTTSDEQVRLVGGNWAVEDARFRSVLQPRSGGGEPMVHDGQYTILWRRLESGEWRMDRYIDRTEALTA